MTTNAVVTGYSAASQRARWRRRSATATATTHVAQARCRDGIAAYWSAGTGPPCVVPKPASATESANPAPGSSRGGITGRTKKTVIPARFVRTRALRAGR
ncbi:hypothetical protein amrb99_81700 [Actinomadura sp. RB99]|nr:hypothetical protein [Actinomadura sp. RB99]